MWPKHPVDSRAFAIPVGAVDPSRFAAGRVVDPSQFAPGYPGGSAQRSCGCGGGSMALVGADVPDVLPSTELRQLGAVDANTYAPIRTPPSFQGGCRDVLVRPAEPEVLAACEAGTCPPGQNCYGVQVNDNITFPGSWSGTRFMCSPARPTDIEIWFLVTGGFYTEGRPYPAGTRIVSVTPYRPAVSARRVRVCGWEFGVEATLVPPVGYVGPGPMPPR